MTHAAKNKQIKNKHKTNSKQEKKLINPKTYSHCSNLSVKQLLVT